MELVKSVELFVMVSMSDTPTVNYWHYLEIIVLRAKYEITKECRIGDTSVTS